MTWGSRFFLDKKDKRGYYTIYLDMGIGCEKLQTGDKTTYINNRIRFSTKEKIQKRDWDLRKQLPKEHYENYSLVKNELEKIAKKVEEIKRTSRSKNLKLTKEFVKQVDKKTRIYLRIEREGRELFVPLRR